MKYIISFSLFSIATFCAGILLYMYSNGYIIFTYPSYHTNIIICKKNMQHAQQKLQLYYWNRHAWQTESIIAPVYHDTGEMLHYLMNHWLILLEQEHLLHKKITVETVLVSSDNQIAYVSFDHNPFNKEETTYHKWMFIESILKTIRENNSSIRSVLFLLNHQQLYDAHLDFTNPWPVYGFLVA